MAASLSMNQGVFEIVDFVVKTMSSNKIMARAERIGVIIKLRLMTLFAESVVQLQNIEYSWALSTYLLYILYCREMFTRDTREEHNTEDT
jgi:hypothetical protein